MNLRKGFFRLTIFVSVIVTVGSLYFFWWRVFSLEPLYEIFDYDIAYWVAGLAKAIGCSLMSGVAVWVIYFFAKFVVEGFIGGEESQK